MSSSSLFNWENIRDYGAVVLGTVILALAMDLFLIPAQLAAGGVSGLAQIINYYTGWPIGLMTLAANAPLFALGWRHLGGPRFALRTAVSIVIFSLVVDGLAPYLPPHGLTHDPVLNALYGAVVSGVGYGLVYRGRGTSGGSDILARILNHWRAVPISTSYLLVDFGLGPVLQCGLARPFCRRYCRVNFPPSVWHQI